MTRARAVVLGIGLSLLPAVRAADADGGPAEASAARSWRQEFDELCGKTQDAMTLSATELSDLVARCDRLKPALEKLDDSERKVFTRRLKACRDLYQFVLDTRSRG